jgi:FKBP-type peptidyl-prolyl cis-trans isomerase FkpA
MSNVTAVPLQPVKRRYLIWLWLGIALALAAAVALARQGDPALVREARGAGVTTTASGLQYKILEPGAGNAPRPTDTDVALVEYEGRLLDGTTFDKSAQPTPFPVAPGATVPGFAEAMKLLRKGEKGRFWLPAKLGYGDRDIGRIPPNSTLVFDLKMVEFLPEEVVRQMQAQQGMAPGGPPPGR